MKRSTRTIPAATLLAATVLAASIAGIANDVTGLGEWPADFFNATGTTATVEDFSRMEVRGFPVYIESTLQNDSPEDVDLFLDLAVAHLTLLENMVSHDILVKLRTVNIWLTDNNCRHTAAFYHRKNVVVSWLEANGRPAEMAGGTEFCRVDYLVESDNLAAYFIHELAHGFHDHYLNDGFDNRIIVDAYDRQWPLMLYYNVLKADGDYDDEGHANSNAIEYFAHLSNKYLGTDGEYPFVQAELRRHDNWGWQVADAAWRAGGFESRWLGCEQIGQVSSGYNSNRIRLTFANRTGALRYLIWIDQTGEVRWDYNEWTVRPDESESIGTRRTHLWAVFDEDRECVGLIMPGLESETIELNQ